MKYLKRASLQMTFMNMYVKFQEFSALKEYKGKTEISNFLFSHMGISQIICTYSIPLNRPENQLLYRI